MKKLLIHLSAVLLLFGVFSSAIAKTNRSELKHLTQKADMIVTAKVEKKQSSWNTSKTRIYTKVTLQVDELIKGSERQSSIEVIYPGGEVGEVGELYSHMPSFKADEEVLVFLKKENTSPDYQVVSGETGKFTLVKDENSGEKMTTSNIRLNTLKKSIKEFINSER